MKALFFTAGLLTFLIPFPNTTSGQIPDIDWQFTQDAEYYDKVEQVLRTSDGSYLVCGRETNSYGESMGFATVTVKKISSDGTTALWTRLLTTNYSIPTMLKPIELLSGAGYLVRDGNDQVHILNKETGETIRSTAVLGIISGFVQLNDGTIAILYEKWNTTSYYAVRLVDENFSQIWDKSFGGTGDDVPVSICIGLEGDHLVLAGNSTSGAGGFKSSATVGGWILAIDMNGDKLWDHSTSNTLSQVILHPSKINNNMGQIAGYDGDFSRKEDLYRTSYESDYLHIGTSAGKAWIGGPRDFDGNYITTTFGGSITSVSTTTDGRILVALTDSVVMLNERLKRIWRTADYKGRGVEFDSDEGLIIYGDADYRVIKTKARKLVPKEQYFFRGIFDAFFYYPNEKFPEMAYLRGAFTDLNGDGFKDFYVSGRTDWDWSADDINYNYFALNGYLLNSSGAISKTSSTWTDGSQWSFRFPYNFHFRDFDNDGSVELFNNAMNNVNAGTGQLSAQGTNLSMVVNDKYTDLQWADFDNNGLMDVFINLDAVYLQTAVNVFTKQASTTSFSGTISSPILVDIDADGFVDIVDRQGKAIYRNQSMVFTKQPTAMTHTPMFAVELNGDGLIDFIGNTGSSYYAFINNGNFAFTYNALTVQDPILVGDINNDGKTDIAGRVANAYFIYFNNGAGAFSLSTSGEYCLPSSFGARPVLVPGDYDNDGDLDVALLDSYQMLFMNNHQSTDNTAPSSPGGLASSRSGNTVTLSWDAANDDTTPAQSLTYNVYIKNGSKTIVSAHSIHATGKRILINSGNAGLARVFKISGLPVGTYQWSVQAIDKGYEPSAFANEQVFYITNNPTNLQLSNASVPENSTATIGEFTTTDPDSDETFSYTLVSGTGSGDNALFKITGKALSAVSTTSLNYEAKSTYSIRVRTTDSRGGFFEKAFTITVTNVQETATDITLTASSLDENKPAGTVVGQLDNNDDDAGDTHTFSLVAGAGDTDNASFEISGIDLLSKAVFNYELKSSFSIRVRTADQNGNAFEKILIITVIDVNDLVKPVVNAPTMVKQNEFSISWAVVEGATNYEVEVSDNGFSSLLTGYNPKNVSTTSLTISGLSPGISYQVRMRATKGVQKSPDSDPLTQITIPPEPTALDPIQIDVASFTAAWTASVGATRYELEVSVGSGAFVPMSGYNPKEVEGAFDYVVTELTPTTVYKYRVRAVNGAGKSGYSNEKSLETKSVSSGGPTTVSISEPLAFTATLPTTATTAQVTAQINGGGGTKHVQLKFRPVASSGSYSAVEMSNTSGANYVGMLPASAFDQMGSEFFVHVVDDTGEDQSQSYYIYRSFSAEAASAIPSIVRFGGNKKTYQIISIPYDLRPNDGIADIFEPVLGAYDKTKWRLTRYQNERFTDYQAGISKIELGKSYWFTSVGQATIKPPAGTAPKFNQADPFELSLAKGWNQIATPYPFNIDWDDVLADNGNPPGVGNYKVFNAEQLAFEESNQLKPYEGGFVFADNAISLSISVALKSSAGGRKATHELSKSIDAETWFLPLVVKQGDVTSTEGGIGMHPMASISKDRWDEVSMPRFFDFLETNFYHPEFFWPRFSRDIVPTAEEYEWKLTVESNGSDDIQLSWDNSPFAHSTSAIFLYDRAEGTLLDMRHQSNITFQETTRKELAIIFRKDGEYIPDMTMLGKPWPNPASTTVHVPVTIADGAPSYVEIGVFDLNGRELKNINIGILAPGFHDLAWDGSDVNDDPVSNGLYVIRLKVNGIAHPIARKIIFNR